jgi:hypothetical protein
MMPAASTVVCELLRQPSTRARHFCPMRTASSTNYSIGNQLLAWSQCLSSRAFHPRTDGDVSALEGTGGGTVRKGEKGPSR